MENAKLLLNCTDFVCIITSMTTMSRSDYALCVKRPGSCWSQGLTAKERTFKERYIMEDIDVAVVGM